MLKSTKESLLCTSCVYMDQLMYIMLVYFILWWREALRKTGTKERWKIGHCSHSLLPPSPHFIIFTAVLTWGWEDVVISRQLSLILAQWIHGFDPIHTLIAERYIHWRMGSGEGEWGEEVMLKSPLKKPHSLSAVMFSSSEMKNLQGCHGMWYSWQQCMCIAVSYYRNIRVKSWEFVLYFRRAKISPSVYMH